MADCQLNCVGQVVQKITAPTVWGTELLWEKPKHKEKVDIKEIMQIKSNSKCPGSPPGGKDAAKRFMAYAAKLGPAAKAVLNGQHFGALKKYVTEQSYDCQQDC